MSVLLHIPVYCWFYKRRLARDYRLFAEKCSTYIRETDDQEGLAEAFHMRRHALERAAHWGG